MALAVFGEHVSRDRSAREGRFRPIAIRESRLLQTRLGLCGDVAHVWAYPHDQHLCLRGLVHVEPGTILGNSDGMAPLTQLVEEEQVQLNYFDWPDDAYSVRVLAHAQHVQVDTSVPLYHFITKLGVKLALAYGGYLGNILRANFNLGGSTATVTGEQLLQSWQVPIDRLHGLAVPMPLTECILHGCWFRIVMLGR